MKQITYLVPFTRFDKDINLAANIAHSGIAVSCESILSQVHQFFCT